MSKPIEPINEDKGKVDLFGRHAPSTVESTAALLAHQTTALKNNLIVAVVHKRYPKIKQSDAVALVENMIQLRQLVCKYEKDGTELYYLENKLILTIFPKKIVFDNDEADNCYQVEVTFRYKEESAIILNG